MKYPVLFISIGILLLLTMVGGFPAWSSVAVLEVESSSFLKSASTRDSSSSTVRIGPNWQDEGSIVEGKVDFQAYTYLIDSTSITPEVDELYIGTSKKLMHNHRVRLGKVMDDWSTFDREWQFGLWNPRFLWDPLHPREVGMPGLFYNYQSRYWKVNFFGSPITVPERGAPVYESDGKITTRSPFFVPLPERVRILNQDAQMRYSLELPPIEDAVLRPGVALRTRFGGETGAWVSGAAGYLPIHQTDLAVDASFLPEFIVDAKVYPRYTNHRLYSLEAGFAQKSWGIWGSTTREEPDSISTPDGWIFELIGPAWINSAGASASWEQWLHMRVSGIMVLEDKPAKEGRFADSDLSIPSRFMFERASMAEVIVDQKTSTVLKGKYTYDLTNLSGLMSIDIQYYPNRSKYEDQGTGWQFGIGTDFITTGTGVGWYGQYLGDDRIRGKVSYVF